MSFASFVMLLLLGCCSLGRLYVLQSPEKEPAAPRSLEQLLQAFRKTLLSGLRLQVVPQLPANGLTGIREQWKATFPAIPNTARNQAGPVVTSVGPALVNSTELKCYQTTSQISLKDLGWENWIVYPETFTFVQCIPCNSQLDPSTLSCPSPSPNPQTACQPASQEMLSIVYMDQGSMVISSVQLTRTCGCGPPSAD